MPEKAISDIPRSIREFYEKGIAAIQKANFDYAIAILNQVLQKEPGFYACREALREAQFRKAGEKAGFFRKVLGTASNSPAMARGQLMLRSNPTEAMVVAEGVLNNDPYSGPAHKLLAEAALALDLPKTAVLSLEIAVKNNPKDREIALKLGEALGRSGNVQRAEMVLTELARSYPNDPSIAQTLKNVSANRTMKEGGYDTLSTSGGTYRDILRDKEEAVSIEQEHRQVKSDDVVAHLIGEYEERLLKEPLNMKLLRQLGELHTQKKDYDRALDYFNRIASAEGGSDSSLEKIIAETTLKKYDHIIETLNPQAPDYDQEVARLKAERLAFELDECKRRAERYPTDLQIRFELGQLYFNAGKISEAIQEFQKAQANPHRRVQSLKFLGQCFAKRGMLDLAARTLQNAIKEKQVFDDEKKELIYSLGVVYEKMGKAADAVEQFKQVYEIDIGYRDVAAKVDAFYSTQAQG